jgi:nucleoside-diphosphate-sugar epimerase
MIKGKIYNVGGKNLNYSKKQIAELVKSKIDYRIIESDIKDKDLRHFYINFDKIKNLGFVPKKTVQEGIDELINIFKFYEPTSDFNVI